MWNTGWPHPLLENKILQVGNIEEKYAGPDNYTGCLQLRRQRSHFTPV